MILWSRCFIQLLCLFFTYFAILYSTSKDGSGAPVQSESTRLLTLRELLTHIVASDRLSTNSGSSDPGVPLSECNWLLDYLVLHFCLLPNMPNIPRPDVLPRTSSQLLTVTCLSRLCRLYPHLFLVPLQLDRYYLSNTETMNFPTAGRSA